nr:MAG TPA: hypothetical protein [Caudoviricetes sp.]
MRLKYLICAPVIGSPPLTVENTPCMVIFRYSYLR